MWDDKVAQQGKIFSAKPDNLNSMHWIHMTEGEIWLPQVVLYLYTCTVASGNPQSYIYTVENINNNKIVIKVFKNLVNTESPKELNQNGTERGQGTLWDKTKQEYMLGIPNGQKKREEKKHVIKWW